MLKNKFVKIVTVHAQVALDQIQINALFVSEELSY